MHVHRHTHTQLHPHTHIYIYICTHIFCSQLDSSAGSSPDRHYGTIPSKWVDPRLMAPKRKTVRSPAFPTGSQASEDPTTYVPFRGQAFRLSGAEDSGADDNTQTVGEQNEQMVQNAIAQIDGLKICAGAWAGKTPQHKYTDGLVIDVMDFILNATTQVNSLENTTTDANVDMMLEGLVRDFSRLQDLVAPFLSAEEAEDASPTPKKQRGHHRHRPRRHHHSQSTCSMMHTSSTSALTFYLKSLCMEIASLLGVPSSVNALKVGRRRCHSCCSSRCIRKCRRHPLSQCVCSWSTLSS